MSRLRNLLKQESGAIHWRLLFARLAVAPLPAHAGGRLRPAALRLAGFRVGKGTIMLGMPEINGPDGLYDNLQVGQNVFFNVGCILDLESRITIGDEVALGHGVILMTTSHAVGGPVRRAGPLFARPVSIGSGTWLGSRSIILPGTTVGHGAVVAAGAVVNRDVPPNTVVGGVPARVIRELPEGPGMGPVRRAEATS